MSVVGETIRGVGRTVNRAATATTAAAGAVGGAAVNGVVGGVKGAAEGVQRGLTTGSKSTPAAALAMGAIGVAGLIEWPVLLAVGGGALLLRRLNRKPEPPAPAATPAATPASGPKAKLTTVPTKPEPEKAQPQKAASKPAVKKTAGRRAGTSTLRSTN